MSISNKNVKYHFFLIYFYFLIFFSLFNFFWPWKWDISFILLSSSPGGSVYMLFCGIEVFVVLFLNRPCYTAPTPRSVPMCEGGQKLNDCWSCITWLQCLSFFHDFSLCLSLSLSLSLFLSLSLSLSLLFIVWYLHPFFLWFIPRGAAATKAPPWIPAWNVHFGLHLFCSDLGYLWQPCRLIWISCMPSSCFDKPFCGYR